ncbi:hypothetical protein CHS0354_001873 [Potamilus streckersoni]|uniref:Uncharacterized protein n=1 Tax=Potamilus streckersoni TaxID=2493646 RepID=A0AAE0TG14_9BIVA|nr:hypothetical protein CHS0354_001873 [Potamilus streckersoni]
MSLQFLCGLMVFVLLASNTGRADDNVDNPDNNGADSSQDGPNGFAEELALAGGKIDYLFAIMAGQMAKLSLEVDTLKNAIQKYTGVEPAPEPGSIDEANGHVGPEPLEPEPGSIGGRSTLQRLAKLLAERKLTDQKESKINALKRMLEHLQ